MANATWLANPGSDDYNTAANWDTGTVPTGTAFFDTSGVTNLSFSVDTSVGGWSFNILLPPAYYNFTNSHFLSFNGDGISNGGSASITNNYVVQFYFDSTAGSAAITNNVGGTLYFSENTTAGSASITNSAEINFLDRSTAGNAAIKLPAPFL